MKSIFAFSVTASVFLATAAHATPPLPPPSSVAPVSFDQIIDQAVADGFAGQVVVAKGSSMLYQRAAGHSDAAGTVPVRSDTLFHVASITKYLTAILTLKAAEEGRIDLDQDIGRFFPDSGLADRGTTIGQLLSHRSGMGSSYAAETEQSAEAAARAIAAQPVDADKIGKFRYSNDGYDLLAIILEQVYGKPYEALLREKIAGPGGLSHMVGWSEPDKSDAAVVSQPLSAIDEKLSRRNYGMIGSAGLMTTAADLVALQQALVAGSILGPESLAQLWKARDRISIGETTFGGFLGQSAAMGPIFNVRGFEDWGDNAILNHYRDQDLYVAVVTSKGPAEDSGKKPFRDTISQAIEPVLPRLR